MELNLFETAKHEIIIKLGSKPLQDANCLNNSFMMVSTV